jgi:hypothetical protein
VARRPQEDRFGVQMTNIAVSHLAEPLYRGINDLSNRHTHHGGLKKIVNTKLLISRHLDGSGRAARHTPHTYPKRSSIEPTTIMLKKQKYRLIGIGPFTCGAIAGALERRA